MTERVLGEKGSKRQQALPDPPDSCHNIVRALLHWERASRPRSGLSSSTVTLQSTAYSPPPNTYADRGLERHLHRERCQYVAWWIPPTLQVSRTRTSRGTSLRRTMVATAPARTRAQGTTSAPSTRRPSRRAARTPWTSTGVAVQPGQQRQQQDRHHERIRGRLHGSGKRRQDHLLRAPEEHGQRRPTTSASGSCRATPTASATGGRSDLDRAPTRATCWSYPSSRTAAE